MYECMLYACIYKLYIYTNQAGLKGLREALDKRKKHNLPTSKLVKMAQFVLKTNYFQFSDKMYQQISETAIGTKFAPPYACIFITQVESKFLQTQKFQSLVPKVH